MESEDQSKTAEDPEITICKQCDLVVERTPVEKGELLICPLCMGAMGRHHVHPFETSLSFALAALVPFAVVLTFPFLTLSAGGFHGSSTVAETAGALFERGFPSIGVLVFLMTLALPLLRLLAFIYVLLPLAWSGVPAPNAWFVFRTAETIAPWAMLDVYMIGVLVAVIKLLDLAAVTPEVGLFAFVALMLLTAASSATMDRETIWDRIRRDTA
jgi:paraquat-inducible protein A